MNDLSPSILGYLFSILLHYSFTYLGDNPGQLVTGHAGVAGVAEGLHLVLGNVDVGVADAAELDVELDVVVPADVATDVDLGKVALGLALGQGLGHVHTGHC